MSDFKYFWPNKHLLSDVCNKIWGFLVNKHIGLLGDTCKQMWSILINNHLITDACNQIRGFLINIY